MSAFPQLIGVGLSPSLSLTVPKGGNGRVGVSAGTKLSSPGLESSWERLSAGGEKHQYCKCLKNQQVTTGRSPALHKIVPIYSSESLSEAE